MNFGQLKKRIIENKELPYQCCVCGCDGNWYGGTISLELHHKDGNHNNNQLNNLEFRCPNCHALTESWCKSRRSRCFDEDKFLELIYQGLTIRKALLSLGLSDSSANYKKAYKVLVKNNQDYCSYGAKDEKTNLCKRCGQPIMAGSHYCPSCHNIQQRTVDRPSPEDLIKSIAETSFVRAGAKYGVSDKTIVKWLRGYGLPTTKQSIINIYTNKKMPL